MPQATPPRGALRKGAPFAFWVLLLAAATATADCPVDRRDATVAIAYVFDGDTVRLTDGRKVRFIGINTPEIGHDGEPSEPYAETARERVRALLGERGHTLVLRYGKERHDRYGRVLAHPFFEDGTSLNVELLHAGLATTLTVPPNDWNRACYGGIEAGARHAGRGIWSLPRYQVTDSRRIDLSASGYRLVSGRVERIGRSRKSVWLNLEGPVAVRIPRKYLEAFGDVERFKGRRVTARGWVRRYRDTLQLTVRHPADLESEQEGT